MDTRLTRTVIVGLLLITLACLGGVIVLTALGKGMEVVLVGLFGLANAACGALGSLLVSPSGGAHTGSVAISGGEPSVEVNTDVASGSAGS